MSDPLSTVQSAYACFGRGDIPALLQLLSPEVVWRFVGDRNSGYAGRCSGHAQVAEWFGRVAQADAIELFEPREFLAGDGHVTVIGFERTRALPAGAVFETEWVHVWRLHDGLIGSFYGMLDTEAAAAARH